MPTTIYVGTDIGVLRSVDGGVSWSVLDDIHFPRVTVSDLVLNQAAGVLCAATYGRGVFKFAMPSGPVIAVNLENSLSFGTICKGPAFLTLEVYNVGVKDLVDHQRAAADGLDRFQRITDPRNAFGAGGGRGHRIHNSIRSIDGRRRAGHRDHPDQQQ